MRPMSFFGWFKSTPQTPSGQASSARSGAAAAGQRHSGDPKGGSDRSEETTADIAARRKSERARLRELLFNVVRESMVRVGVLSSGFKFKVLATDPRGRKFIVMMDLSREFGSEIAQLAEIEALICQSAKARHSIVVSAVYWRAENALAASKNGGSQPGEKYRAAAPPATTEAPSPAVSALAKSRFEPVLADEITALKRALATGSAGTVAAAMKPPAKTVPTNPAFLTGFENTEIIESEMPEHEVAETEMLDDDALFPALSPTQYGDLR
jgi:hypothetical protein